MGDTNEYEPRAGDLLRGPNGEVVLVGHVNTMGGECDCCSGAIGFSLWPYRLLPGWSLERNVLAKGE